MDKPPVGFGAVVGVVVASADANGVGVTTAGDPDGEAAELAVTYVDAEELPYESEPVKLATILYRPWAGGVHDIP